MLAILCRSVTSGEAHLRDLAPGQHSFEETSQRCRTVGDTVFDLTHPGIEPQNSLIDSNAPTTELTSRLALMPPVTHFDSHEDGETSNYHKNALLA